MRNAFSGAQRNAPLHDKYDTFSVWPSHICTLPGERGAVECWETCGMEAGEIQPEK